MKLLFLAALSVALIVTCVGLYDSRERAAIRERALIQALNNRSSCPVYHGADDMVLTELQVRTIVETTFALPTAQDSIVLSEALVPGYERNVPDGTVIVPFNDHNLNK
jgi:hypothetical protein